MENRNHTKAVSSQWQLSLEVLQEPNSDEEGPWDGGEEKNLPSLCVIFLS